MESKDVENTLQKPGIHQLWENSYRTEENERFYEQVFDYITSVLDAPQDTAFLDVGCGIGAHSVRLATRGFSVLAIDFSEYILQTAKINVQNNGLADRIKLQRDNILALSFADNTFDYILCWGVLMHIPDIEIAISELDRVLKKGGVLVIGEGNMFSLQSILQRNLRRIRGKEKANMTITAAGVEYRIVTPTGKLLTRQANIQWLKKQFQNKGYIVKKHVSGQFTELYTKFSSGSIKKFIHYFNYLWFKYVKTPHLAFGNIIILEKQL